MEPVTTDDREGSAAAVHLEGRRCRELIFRSSTVRVTSDTGIKIDYICSFQASSAYPFITSPTIASSCTV